MHWTKFLGCSPCDIVLPPVFFFSLPENKQKFLDSHVEYTSRLLFFHHSRIGICCPGCIGIVCGASTNINWAESFSLLISAWKIWPTEDIQESRRRRESSASYYYRSFLLSKTCRYNLDSKKTPSNAEKIFLNPVNGREDTIPLPCLPSSKTKNSCQHVHTKGKNGRNHIMIEAVTVPDAVIRGCTPGDAPSLKRKKVLWDDDAS